MVEIQQYISYTYDNTKNYKKIGCQQHKSPLGLRGSDGSPRFGAIFAHVDKARLGRHAGASARGLSASADFMRFSVRCSRGSSRLSRRGGTTLLGRGEAARYVGHGSSDSGRAGADVTSTKVRKKMALSPASGMNPVALNGKN